MSRLDQSGMLRTTHAQRHSLSNRSLNRLGCERR
ncbi:hypothetical protein SAMN05446935_4085 [Burkholderia sp. YR290]|nr:hypothetical protein SAMN05446935_4085 [Burkholderia sp. YR290]